MSEAGYRSLLGRPDLAGVYHFPPGDDDALRQAAQDVGYGVFEVNLGQVRDRGGLYTAIARDMDFPAWFGHNRDALRDCLGDLDWRPAAGYLVFLRHCDGVRVHAEEDFTAVLNTFTEAAAEWRERNRCFWCLVDMQSDGIAWLPTIADMP